MTLNYFGERIIVFDDETDLQDIDQVPSSCSVILDPIQPFFSQPLMKRYPDEAALTKAVGGRARPPLPMYVPAGLRPLGRFMLESPAGEISDIVFAFVEESMKVQQLFRGSRPLIPDDAALTIYWSRRFSTPLALRRQQNPEVERLSRLISSPPRRVQIRASIGALLKYTAAPGGAALRSRRIPDEAVLWYDESQQAWLSVHANLAPGEALRIANSIEV